MTNGQRPIEGYRGFTIDADRVVRNRFGKVIKHQVKSKNGIHFVVIGNVKDGTRAFRKVGDLYQMAFGPRVIEDLSPDKLKSAKRKAAFETALGDVTINQMFDDLQRGVKARGPVPFSLPYAAEVLAAIGQNREFKRWTR